MKTLFKSFDLWDFVENGFVDLAAPEQATRLTATQPNELKEKQKDAKALFLIQQALDEAIFPRVMAATTSKEAWDLLQEEYQGSANSMSGNRKLSMKSSDSIQEFFSKVTSIVNQIRSFGKELTDQKNVEKALQSLPPKFDHVVAAIEESKDLSDYSLHELMGSLQAHEQRLNRTTEAFVQHAFQSRLDLKKQ